MVSLFDQYNSIVYVIVLIIERRAMKRILYITYHMRERKEYEKEIYIKYEY